jgi:hypothetical protein
LVDWSARAIAGRLTACARTLAYGAIPLGALLAGGLGTLLGVRAAFWVMTACSSPPVPFCSPGRSGTSGDSRTVHIGRTWSAPGSVGGEVFLAADEIGLGQPGTYVGVDILGTEQAKGVQNVARGVFLHPEEPRVVQSPREHDMPVQTVPAGDE